MYSCTTGRIPDAGAQTAAGFLKISIQLENQKSESHLAGACQAPRLALAGERDRGRRRRRRRRQHRGPRGCAAPVWRPAEGIVMVNRTPQVQHTVEAK